MVTSAPNRLLWRDRQSTREARKALAEFGRVELDLPPNFHHALFAHLQPRAEAGHRPEVLDIEGHAELLRRIADIQGLDDLAELADMVAEADGSVRVRSPSPTITLNLPEEMKHAR